MMIINNSIPMEEESVWKSAFVDISIRERENSSLNYYNRGERERTPVSITKTATVESGKIV